MVNIAIVGYATIMDPDNARKIGLEGTSDLVWINECQRFFGFPDYNLERKTLDQVFDSQGKLLISNIGATTIQPNKDNRFNSVIYNGVSEGVLDELDRIEGDSHLMRLALYDESIRNFGDNSPWNGGESLVYIYAAEKQIVVPNKGTFKMLRTDVTPHTGYLERCRAAASVQGNEFREAYEDTTFLADRTTTLRESDF